MEDKIIKAIGFVSDNCSFPKETQESLNRRLMRYTSGLKPWSSAWFEKASSFHFKIEELRISRGVSQKKLTPEKLEDITEGHGL